MARTNKKGLDYFSMDVSFFDDDKIQLIEAEFGLKGSYIAVRLLCKIYKEDYFYQWGDDQCLLFSKTLGNGIVPNLVKEVIKGLVKRGFFNESVFNSFNILTSKGIQDRYFDAATRYKSVDVIKEYLLIDVSKMNNVNINSINVNINQINDNNCTQIKVNKKKVNKKKEITPPLIPQGGVDKSKNISKSEFEFPYDSDKFKSTWNLLISMPKWKKKVKHSLQLALKNLGKYDEQFSIELMEKAIEGNYQGVTFPSTPSDYERWKKQKGGNNGNSRAKDYTTV